MQKIKGKNIRNVNRYLKLTMKQQLRICSPELNEDVKNKLKLPKNLNNGDSFLPPIVGNKTKFNAEGKYVPLKNEPKEYRVIGEREWNWTDFGGNHHSKIIDIERLCYKRKFIEPPSFEVTYFDNRLYSDIIDVKNKENLKFLINIFLEIFNECEIVDADRNSITSTETKNWIILPPGEHPFEKIIKSVKGSKRSKDYITATVKRLEFYQNNNPEKTMVGSLGFAGYVMFFFKNFIVLDSINYGDAIYVFSPDKEDICALPKKEILNNKHNIDRIIHCEGWDKKVLEYFK